MFTNLGVLSKLQIYMMGCCMDCFDGGEDAKDRVYSAVDMLVTKGYLAEFMGNEDTIIDPNGACVVYGGRQLGKTALLERA